MINNLKNFIYLDKGYHQGVSESIFKSIRNNDGIIISLDEEGGVDYSNGSTLLGRYTPTLFSSIDMTFFWGPKQLELVQKNIVNGAKTAITGHPRFKLLSPEYHYLYQDEVDEILSTYQDFVLINTNMGFGNNIRGDGFVRSNYGDRFKNIDQIIAFDKEKLIVYRSFVIALSKKINKTIILRPHPEEDQSFYLKAFNNCENVQVISNSTAIPWLIAADTVIHPDCTTAIEALIIGKTPISFLPENYPDELTTHLPLSASTCFTSEAEIIKYLSSNRHENVRVELEKYSFMEDYFSISNSPIESIVKHLAGFKIRDDNNKLAVSLWMRIYLNYMAFKATLPIHKSQQLHKKKTKGLNSGNLRKILNKINFNTGKNVKINSISPGLFHFHSTGLPE